MAVCAQHAQVRGLRAMEDGGVQTERSPLNKVQMKRLAGTSMACKSIMSKITKIALSAARETGEEAAALAAGQPIHPTW